MHIGDALDQLRRFSVDVGITDQIDGEEFEHIIHEVTHALDLGLPLEAGRSGLSSGVAEAIEYRFNIDDEFSSGEHEALCLASEAVSLRLLGLAATVVKNANDASAAGEQESERVVHERLEDYLLMQAEWQGLQGRVAALLGGDKARALGERVAEAMRPVVEGR